MTSAEEYRKILESRNLKLTLPSTGSVELKYISTGDLEYLTSLAERSSGREFAIGLVGHQIRVPKLSSDEIARLPDSDILALARAIAEKEKYLFEGFPPDGELEDFRKAFLRRQSEIAKELARRFKPVLGDFEKTLSSISRTISATLARAQPVSVTYLSAVEKLASQQLETAHRMAGMQAAVMRLAELSPPKLPDLGFHASTMALQRLLEIRIPSSIVAGRALEIASAYEKVQETLLAKLPRILTMQQEVARRLGEYLAVGGLASASYADLAVVLETRRQAISETPRIELADELDLLLREIDPRLVSLRRDAWKALDSSLDNSIRAATHFMRELVTEILHKLAPDDLVRESPVYQKHANGENKITRRARIAFIAGENEEFVFSLSLDQGLLDANNALIAKAHTFSSPKQLNLAKALMKQAEAFVYSLLLLRKPPIH